MSERLVIGTRGSALARWQVDYVAGALRHAHPGLSVESRIIVTTGDLTHTGVVLEVGGKGVWVREIEEALLAGTIDLAVHSLKDVPVELAAGLVLAAFPPRADARDALVSRTGAGLDALPPGSRIGTSSLRRACQVRAARPDLALEILRGNVDTRLRKVADGVVEAAILACAGLDRLGLAERITERLAPERMVPSIGQGALAIEVRGGDRRVAELCAALDDPMTRVAITAERALLTVLGAGCRTPVAGHATVHDGARVLMRALVGRPDASEMLLEEAEGSVADPAAVGAEAAHRLLSRGADRILADLEG